MKTQKTHKYARYFIVVLLISQLWSNVLSTAVLIDFENSNAIELSSDTDIEDENKKELEDKIIFNPFLYLKFHGNSKGKMIQTKNHISSNHLEINLPPPKSTLYI